jgi:hypothetical protein
MESSGQLAWNARPKAVERAAKTPWNQVAKTRGIKWPKPVEYAFWRGFFTPSLNGVVANVVYRLRYRPGTLGIRAAQAICSFAGVAP